MNSTLLISIARNGAEIGEWNGKKVKALYQAGELQGTDVYWHEGMTDWKPVRDFIKPTPSPTLVSIPPLPPTLTIQSKPKKIGIGRLEYVLYLIGWFIVVGVLSTWFIKDHETLTAWGALALICITALRAKNIGFPSAYGLLILIPLVGLVVFVACLFMPNGSAPKRRKA